MEIACCLSLGDAQVAHHLLPIARLPYVTKIWIVRDRGYGPTEIPKCELVRVPRSPTVRRLVHMRAQCGRLAARSEVTAFVSFNPVPYGLIAQAAARRNGKHVHFGFIGTDWYLHGRAPWSRLLLGRFKRADFVTATGASMRREMIDGGIDTRKIAILPHGIDLADFPVAEPEAADITCLFIGQLIHRKRVDIILRGFDRVRRVHPEATLAIVGDGPLRNELEAFAQSLGLADAVTFTGFSHDVYSWIKRARIAVMASDREGLPFSLVESMCSGLVPVSTPAGTIADLIEDGRNGRLVPGNDPDALAAAITQLLDDPARYDRLRNNVLQQRDNFSYEKASEVWDTWLSTLFTS